MPPFRKPNLVTLRRPDLSQPWGFRLAGGVNQGQPFHVQKVIPDSIAHRSGLQEGDSLVRIGNITLKGLTHEEVQEIIVRCMNTIDLFVIRNSESEQSENQSPNENVVNTQYSPYVSGTGAKSLTEQVLNRMVEKDAYYSTDFMDYSNPSSPPLQQQIYVKEREMYEYNQFSSPSQSKSPTSPIQKPPSRGPPFSPVVSPTNISYHQPEEQQWLSSQQPRDNRVFGANPRARSQSPGPSSGGHQQNDGQKDNRVFGVKPTAQSPVMNGSRPTTATLSSATPSPENIRKETKVMTIMSPPPLQDIKQFNINQQNQNRTDPSKDRQFYAQNKKRDNYRNPGFDRPEMGRPINDRRVFGANTWKQKMGGSLDSQPHWKEPLPQLKTVRPDVNQLLPSHTKKQQTYIVQTPPTERNARPPPTGTIRRRIRPVWPPPDFDGRYVPRTGFSRGESPSRKYEWPPSREGSVDREINENGMSPRMRYSTPPPGAFYRGDSESPGGQRAYTPSRRVRNSNWPPLSNATPAGKSGYRPDFAQSLPGSRRGSQAMDSSDFYVYTMNSRIPQTYRAPPYTQYFDQSYHYDTD